VSIIYETISELYDRLEAEPLEPVWISLTHRERTLARARHLASTTLPLTGVSFAVKDNIDVAYTPTTAACPEYSYIPARSATVVKRLEAAGALPIGKTNMDQFATGLTGSRTPYGACSSVYNDNYISGGSSSGSAVAVARGLVRFALGTDAAGSGQIPAAFNNLIGLKPTRGWLSMAGVVPTCRTLDTVSILARDAYDASLAFHAARGSDPADPYSRVPAPGEGAAPWLGGPFRFGVPMRDQLQFFGNEEFAALYELAIQNMTALGGECIRIDFSAFRDAGALLQSGPWVAERLAAISSFMQINADEMNPIVRGVIEGSQRHSAVNAFEAQYRLMELRRAAELQWRFIDVMLLPTAPTIYTHDEIAAEPVKLSQNLGYYASFASLMDLAAVSVPAGLTPGGLPFGVSIVGQALTDDALLILADQFHRFQAEVKSPELEIPHVAPGCLHLALAGEHEIKGSRLLRTERTAPGYRLYERNGKPVISRTGNLTGEGIEVEVWAVPENRVLPELSNADTLGTLVLNTGESVRAILAEPTPHDITAFGTWSAYQTSMLLMR